MIEMQIPKSRSVTSIRARPVASYMHTAGLLGLMFGSIAIALALQSKPGGGPAIASQAIASQRRILPSLLESLAFDWGLLFFVWAGVSRRGGSLWSLSGRRWSSVRDVLRDVVVALPFWVLWEAVAYGSFGLLGKFFGSAQAAPDDTFPVRGGLEISVWILVSCTAGFCEELIFRGYLQVQFTALTGSIRAGVVMQAILFGLIHPRGWRAVVVISLLGVLYGSLAAWRKDLKPGMLAHGFSDLWEGWLKHIVRFPY